VSARTFAVFLAVLAVLALLGFGLLSKGQPALAVGDSAPDPELAALEGDPSASLADYQGRWVLVNVWSSWCEPCEEESPALQRFHDANSGSGFSVVGLNLEDVESDARSFVDRFGLTYPQLRALDNEEVKRQFGITGRPENFLIDPEGRLAAIDRGPVTAESLEQEIAPLIGQR
jgi:cytochrome c biogenesis protein CcmG, thiol:disulfide interchange protein DsbE